MENLLKNTFLWYEINEYLEKFTQCNVVIDREKKCFLQKNQAGKTISTLFPPLIYGIQEEESFAEYCENLEVKEDINFAVVLIQAGAAALGVWWNDECIHHKVITAYMVRKKQGKNQLTHLNRKGKSRQGSRIRLNNTIRFFENINVKLEEWLEEIESCDYLFYSCTPRLWGEVFRSKIACPISREDERWRRVPLDINVPNFKELQRVAFRIAHGTLIAYD